MILLCGFGFMSHEVYEHTILFQKAIMEDRITETLEARTKVGRETPFALASRFKQHRLAAITCVTEAIASTGTNISNM
jgi:hypothetical protein